jgi:hypothetical protein
MPAFVETFETLDAWEIDPGGDGGPFAITSMHATDGETALRVMLDTRYGAASFAMHRLDLVDGEQLGVDYWLRFAFYLRDWGPVWFGNGSGEPFYLPSLTNFDNFDSSGYGPLLDATSASAGVLRWGYPFGSNSSLAITAGAWHSVRIRLTDDGVNTSGEIWVDGVQRDLQSTVFSSPTLVKGVWIGNDLSNVAGTYIIDDLRWSPGADPGEPSVVESAPQESTNQWFKVRERIQGQGTLSERVRITFPAALTEAYHYTEVYVSQELLDAIPIGDYSENLLDGDDQFELYIHRTGASTYLWSVPEDTGEHNWGAVTVGWHRIEWHANTTANRLRVRIDGAIEEIPDPPVITDISYFGSDHYPLFRSTVQGPSGAYVGYDNFAYSLEGWVGDFSEIEGEMLTFEGIDAVEDLVAPAGGQSGSVPGGTIEEGGVPGPGPGLPTGFPGGGFPPPSGDGDGTGSGGGFGGGGGFSGRRFPVSYPWRCIVASGNLDEVLFPVTDEGIITGLDRLASDREMLVSIGAPRRWNCHVPAYDPEVNIPYDDEYGEAFVAEGNRLLYVFRREGGSPPWKIRGSFVLQRLRDAAETEDGRSYITGYDPRQLLYKRPVRYPNGHPLEGEHIKAAGYSGYGGEDAGFIAYDVLESSVDADGSVRIINEEANILTDPESLLDKFHITQGMSVGEVWDQLEATGKVEIYLDPIYDPITFPGDLVRAFYYTRMGTEKPGAVFAWDKPSLSLYGVDHDLDGTLRANNVRFGRGQGGKVVDVVTDPASIAKWGNYFEQQWFPVQKKAAAVTALAERELESKTAGRRTIQVSPVPERAPVPLLDYDLGDTVPVIWSSRLRQGLFVQSRMTEIPIAISDEGLEQTTRATVEPEEWVIGT